MSLESISALIVFNVLNNLSNEEEQYVLSILVRTRKHEYTRANVIAPMDLECFKSEDTKSTGVS